MSNIDWTQRRTAADAVSAEKYRFDRAVDAEADRRINTTLLFGGHTYQFGPDSRENIMGAASSAHIALTLMGAQPGDLYWHGGTDPFVFLTLDNTPVPMDAPTAVAFGQAGARWKSLHIFAGRAIKDADPRPENFADDALWPAPEDATPPAPAV